MFSNDAKSFLSVFFDFMSRVFNLRVPGTTVTFFGLFAGCLVTLFLIRLVSQYINVVGGIGPSLSESTGRSEMRAVHKSTIEANTAKKKYFESRTKK